MSFQPLPSNNKNTHSSPVNFHKFNDLLRLAISPARPASSHTNTHNMCGIEFYDSSEKLRARACPHTQSSCECCDFRYPHPRSDDDDANRSCFLFSLSPGNKLHSPRVFDVCVSVWHFAELFCVMCVLCAVLWLSGRSRNSTWCS